MQDKLTEMQKKLDKIYNEQGLTDEVLDLQLEVNALRHEHDIPDETKKVYKEYVQ